MYGNGHSEEVLGKALEGKRKECIFATKVNKEHLWPADIRRSVETSLKRLRTDYVDIYYVHWPSYEIPIEETMSEFNKLKDEGIIKAIGVSGISLYSSDMAIAEKAIENTATFGVALSSCWLPGSEKKIFEIGEEDMEIGMGIHGEPGVKRGRIASSREITKILLPGILADLSIKEGQEVAILVNGLGATSQEELFILYKDIDEALAEKGIKPVRVFVGEYATSLEMVGASISILKLDDELLELLDAPAYTPFVNVGGVRGA